MVAMGEGGWWGRLGLGKEYQKEYEKECVCIVYGYIICIYIYTHVYINESLCCTEEINTS